MTRLLVLMLLTACNMYAQEKTSPTDKFTVQGKVKNVTTFSLDMAGQYTSTTVDSIVIYNHLMQKKRVIKNIKGVLLKDIIDKAGIDISSPKILSEIFITCIASDGYKVVFSWNELFNTSVGEHVLIITASDGSAAGAGNDRIAILSTMDIATGRRFVKGLEKVIVEQVK